MKTQSKKSPFSTVLHPPHRAVYTAPTLGRYLSSNLPSQLASEPRLSLSSACRNIFAELVVSVPDCECKWLYIKTVRVSYGRNWYECNASKPRGRESFDKANNTPRNCWVTSARTRLLAGGWAVPTQPPAFPFSLGSLQLARQPGGRTACPQPSPPPPGL